MVTKSLRPVTRETSAVVRDKGPRAVIVTVVGGVIELLRISDQRDRPFRKRDRRIRERDRSFR